MDQAVTIPSTEADEYGRPGLCVFAPLHWKLTLVPLSLGLGIFMATVYLRDPSGFASPQRYLVPAMAAVLIVGAVEYLQRVFVFYPDQVRIRILWFWRTVKLPPRIDIGITARREVVLTEVANGRRVLRIPRDYTRSGKLAPELVTYYQGWQRFGDEVI